MAVLSASAAVRAQPPLYGYQYTVISEPLLVRRTGRLPSFGAEGEAHRAPLHNDRMQAKILEIRP